MSVQNRECLSPRDERAGNLPAAAPSALPPPDERHFGGIVLYGDDFGPADIETWFSEEKDGYYGLEAERDPADYGYHALNQRHGFRYLPVRRYGAILGIGAAFGTELEPVVGLADRVVVLEPAQSFRHPGYEYVEPHPSGRMPFADGTFDLVSCFGVLHHIPNVTAVVGEIARVLSPGGVVLIREPVTSMGDWRKPRRGLTRHERGIPAAMLRGFLERAGLSIRRQAACMHSVTPRVARALGVKKVYNSSALVAFDAFMCALPGWSDRYHATRLVDRVRPGSVFLLAEKERGSPRR